MNTMRTSLLSILGLILVIGLTAMAQGTGTNLSGTWKMNPAKSKLPKVPKIQSQTLVIVQDGLQIEFRHQTDGKESVENYTSDKTERVIREVPEAKSRIVGKAYWKGATFITETKAVFTISSALDRYEMMDTKDSWTVSPDGLVLTEKSQWEDGRSIAIYDKQ